MPRALIQYRNPKNYDLVHEALTAAGRTDLIGFDKKCLIRPRKLKSETQERFAYSKNSEHTGKAKNEGKSKKKTIRNVHSKKEK